MRCPDCGGRNYRRNVDRRERELERRASTGDFEAEVQLLRLKMRTGEIPVDYVRRAAALGDRRALALGLEPWPVNHLNDPAEALNIPRNSLWWSSILIGLPKKLLVLFAADVAERVLFIFENPATAFAPPSGNTNDQRPRLAIEAARQWADDPSEENRMAAGDSALATWDAAVGWGVGHSPSGAYYAALACGGAADAAARAAIGFPDDIWTEIDLHTHILPRLADNAVTARLTALLAYVDSFGLGLPPGVSELTVRDAEEAWQTQRLIQYLLGEVQGPSGG